MPKDKVRDAIDDMLRRGLTDLDPLVALMRRGSAALDELALLAERPVVKQALISAVRGQAQRFASTTAALSRSVRQHPLTADLLAAIGGEAIARASLAAWDQGRRDEAAFLADTALALGPESGEVLIASARVATGAEQYERSSELFRRALLGRLEPAMVNEAATALFAAGQTEPALTALVARGSDAALLAGMAAEACLRGELSLATSGLGDKPELVAAAASELERLGRRELTALAGAVAELKQACSRVLSGADALLAVDAVDADLAAAVTAATAVAANLSGVVRLRHTGNADDAVLPTPELAKLARTCGRHGAAAAWLAWSCDAAKRSSWSLDDSTHSLRLEPASVPESHIGMRGYAYHAARAALVQSGCAVAPHPPGLIITIPASEAAVAGSATLRAALASAFGAAGGDVIEPVTAIIESIRTALMAISDVMPAVGPDLDASPLIALHSEIARNARASLARCDALAVYARAVARPAATAVQPVQPLIDELAERARPAISRRAATLRVIADTTPAVSLDRSLLTDALELVTLDVAETVEAGAMVTLGLAHDRDARVVSINVSGLHARPLLSPLSATLVRLASGVHGGSFSLDADGHRYVFTFSLPAPAAETATEDFAGLAPEGRMAMRAASGLLSTDSDTACFLIAKAVTGEASLRLKPHLARHLLLPRASWLLASQYVRAGLNRDGLVVAGKRVEDLCRAVVDDRLHKRLSDARSYALCLALFASAGKGEPAPASIPGLPAGNLAALITGLDRLAGFLDNKQAADSLSAARSVLALLGNVTAS